MVLLRSLPAPMQQSKLPNGWPPTPVCISVTLAAPVLLEGIPQKDPNMSLEPITSGFLTQRALPMLGEVPLPARPVTTRLAFTCWLWGYTPSTADGTRTRDLRSDSPVS